MQIVIDIDDNLYTRLFDNRDTDAVDMLKACVAIRKGMPLPKGHGRLIDADELYGDFIDGTEGYDCQTWNRIEIGDIIEDEPTIIEAERSDEEKPRQAEKEESHGRSNQ